MLRSQVPLKLVARSLSNGAAVLATSRWSVIGRSLHLSERTQPLQWNKVGARGRGQRDETALHGTPKWQRTNPSHTRPVRMKSKKAAKQVVEGFLARLRKESGEKEDRSEEDFTALIKPIVDKVFEFSEANNMTAATDLTKVECQDILFLVRLSESKDLVVRAKNGYQTARNYVTLREFEKDVMRKIFSEELRMRQLRSRTKAAQDTVSPTCQSAERARRIVDPADPLLAPVAVHVNETVPTADDAVFSTFSAEVRSFCSAVRNGEIPERIPPEAEELTLPFLFLHHWLMRCCYYGSITKETAHDIALNVGDGVVLDPLAGSGYGVKALREAGVRTIGSDINSSNPAIEKLDAVESLKKYGSQITHLLISWAPHGSDIDHQLLREVRANFPHVTIINIGEGEEGCTGSEQFWYEAETMEPQYLVRYRCRANLFDGVTFMK